MTGAALPLIVKILYALGAALFVSGLKGLSSPKTAVRGNLTGALGMAFAVVGALLQVRNHEPLWIVAGAGVGLAVGVGLALRVDFKAMPQLVGLFNGLGGLASVFVAAAMILVGAIGGARESSVSAAATAATGIVGAVTFWGSIVAFGKLQGLVSEKPLRYRGEQAVKIAVALLTLSLAVLYFRPELAGLPDRSTAYWLMVAAASVLGLLLTLPIGGADMPIVIALLNSYSGIAAAASGFVLDPPNLVLIIAGALVGASGVILTRAMCKAMNRSLVNVLFGGVGAAPVAVKGEDIYAGRTKATGAEEIAQILKSAGRVVIVPGYGMAVGRAATPVRQLFEAMEKDGIEVDFGIHPVAGRMPGHMNVLLAEENIPYERLKDLDEINGTFPNTDVVVVIGANDVVNPAARDTVGGPISGMPILDVDKARTVIVVKRSLSPGFAGISNPLFVKDIALMYFADAKKGMEDVLRAYREAD